VSFTKRTLGVCDYCHIRSQVSLTVNLKISETANALQNLASAGAWIKLLSWAGLYRRAFGPKLITVWAKIGLRGCP